VPDDQENIPKVHQLVDPEEWTYENSEAIKQRCFDGVREVVSWVESCSDPAKSVLWFEPKLVAVLFSLGVLLTQLFLARADEAYAAQLGQSLVRAGVRHVRRPRQGRLLGTFFGKLKYWRTYFAPTAEAEDATTRAGIYPVDEKVGIGSDGFTMNLVSLATRMATKMAFDASAATLALFLRWSPAKKTIEDYALGLGGFAHDFQAQEPAPADDGEVLVIQPDSKGVPTATDQELRRRRGKRKPNAHPESKRHRGRSKRRRNGPRRRRKPGDKSKNARMATMVVMYTLKKATDDKGNPILLGPLNVRILASFAPKKYAFQVARREAKKRGFGPESGKLIQFIHDGDDDLELYRKQYFGDYQQDKIIVTSDLPHVMEYLWTAGAAVHKEGSGKLSRWVSFQKRRLLAGRAHLVRRELSLMLASIPTRGPGNKGKRERLTKALKYLTDNAHRLDYKRVRAMDLELASGIVEGAIRHVIGLRFDHGGMRWIRERAEALLQLRCIEVNGQWDTFIQWVHDKRHSQISQGHLPRLRCATAPALPTVASLELGCTPLEKAA
jgi:hypothetical protein